jgi:hypothetical protein
LGNAPGRAFQDRVCEALCGDTEVIGAKEGRVAKVTKKTNTPKKSPKTKPAKKSKKKKR